MRTKEGCTMVEALREAHRALELVIALRESRGGLRIRGAVVELDPKADAQVRAAAEKARARLETYESIGCEPL